MSKIVLADLPSGFASTQALNQRFGLIEDALNQDVVWRSPVSGEANAMSQDLDLGSNSLLNVAEGVAATDGINLGQVTTLIASTANSTILELGLSLGNVLAPASAPSDGDSVLFDGVTGKLLKKGTIATFALLGSTPAALNQIVTLRGHTIAGTGGGQFIAKAGSVTNDGGTQINSATVGLYWQRINYRYLSSDMFGTTGSGADETTNVQKGLTTVTAPEYLLIIPNGTKFNLSSLTFPARSNLQYRVDDDLSNPSPASDIGSGERVYYSANSSYPVDASGGVVNEWRKTAAFHPGSGVDVRKSVTGHDAYLGVGQSRLSPARASWSIWDDQESKYSVLYEHYNAWSYFSGIKLNGYRTVFTLNGIGTAQWTSVAALGTVITGNTSGAKGFLLSVTAGATIVLWYSGRFIAGEKLIDDNETTTATVTTAVYTSTSFNPISQGLMRGNWSVGLPPESALRRAAWAVGGSSGVQATRTFSQYLDETITDPVREWVDSYENSPPNGYQIAYKTAPAAAARRLTLQKYQTTVDIGLIGATRASIGFTNGNAVGGIWNASAFNIASIARNGTGDYTITFTAAFTRADYQVTTGQTTINDRTCTFSRTTTALRVQNYNLAGVLTDLAGEVSIICTCGDI